MAASSERNAALPRASGELVLHHSANSRSLELLVAPGSTQLLEVRFCPKAPGATSSWKSPASPTTT